MPKFQADAADRQKVTDAKIAGKEKQISDRLKIALKCKSCR
jgi:hypothetical protein